MPAAIAIPLIAGAASAGASVAAAKMSSNAAQNAAKTNAQAQQNIANTSTQAANHAADLQAQANKDALAFQQQQAAQSRADAIAAQRANYDLYAARERRLGDLGASIGLAPRQIPAYAEPPELGTLSSGLKATTQVPNGDYQAYFNSLTGGKPLDQAGLMALEPQLTAAGIQITPPNKEGVRSKIGLPNGQWVRVLNGDTSQANPTVWIPQDGGSAGSVTTPATQSPYTFRSVFSTLPPVTGNLQMPRPGTLAALAGYR